MAPKKAVAPSKKTKKADKEGRKEKKAKKDKNAPKRGLSAYFFFAKEQRETKYAKDEELRKDVKTLIKMIAEDWRKLSDAQKGPYNKMAEQDKARYQKEKAAYAKKKEH